MLQWIILAIATPFVFLLYPTRIIGKKYLKRNKKEAMLYSCNHQSNNDVIVLKSRVKWNSKFMAKDSLFKNKAMKGCLKMLGAYPVKRGGNDIESIKHTLRLLKSNNHIVVFPEGTRVKGDEAVEYKNGLVFFALKSDCLVAPMAFRKKPRVLHSNTLLIGEPFRFSEYDEFKGVTKPNKEILNLASKILTDKMEYLKNVDIKEYKKLTKENLKNSK